MATLCVDRTDARLLNNAASGTVSTINLGLSRQVHSISVPASSNRCVEADRKKGNNLNNECTRIFWDNLGDSTFACAIYVTGVHKCLQTSVDISHLAQSSGLVSMSLTVVLLII